MCLSVVVGMAALVAAPELLAPALGARWGRIIIEGNTDTPDRVVLDLLDFRPGQRIGVGSVQEARRRLRACNSFQYNPWRGVGPVVELVPNEFDSLFWDVRIRVVDRPGSWIGYSLSALFRAAAYAVVHRDPDAAHAVYRELEYIVDRTRRESRREP